MIEVMMSGVCDNQLPKAVIKEDRQIRRKTGRSQVSAGTIDDKNRSKSVKKCERSRRNGVHI